MGITAIIIAAASVAFSVYFFIAGRSFSKDGGGGTIFVALWDDLEKNTINLTPYSLYD
ncbi:MAG: hypothetical protein ACFFAS_12460 [Promethearchaeota archaeon]